MLPSSAQKEKNHVGQILFDLPIMQAHGQHVHVTVNALRRYEDFAADVKARLA